MGNDIKNIEEEIQPDILEANQNFDKDIEKFKREMCSSRNIGKYPYDMCDLAIKHIESIISIICEKLCIKSKSNDIHISTSEINDVIRKLSKDSIDLAESKFHEEVDYIVAYGLPRDRILEELDFSGKEENIITKKINECKDSLSLIYKKEKQNKKQITNE